MTTLHDTPLTDPVPGVTCTPGHCGCAPVPRDTPAAEPAHPAGPARSRRGLLAAVVGVLCVVGCAAGPLALAGLAAAAGAVSGLWAVAAAGMLAGVVVVALRRRRRTC